MTLVTRDKRLSSQLFLASTTSSVRDRGDRRGSRRGLDSGPLERKLISFSPPIDRDILRFYLDGPHQNRRTSISSTDTHFERVSSSFELFFFEILQI